MMNLFLCGVDKEEDNYYVPLYDNYGAGQQFNCYITIQATQTQVVPAPTITASISVSDVAGTAVNSINPSHTGLYTLIAQAVVTAMGDTTEPNSVVELLYSILTEESAGNILTADQTNQIQAIYSYLTTTITYHVDNLEGNQVALYNMILQKLNEILNTGASDTAAANALSQAGNAMESAANAMNVSKPNINNVIPQTLVSDDVATAQGTIFNWLGNGYITAILVATFTIALIGFVLYGKSG